MSNILVTGGAGFIGRWMVKALLEDGHEVWVLDNMSNGNIGNLHEFLGHARFRSLIQGDIRDSVLLQQLFRQPFDICYHLAASINVQDSIDDPSSAFSNDTIGAFQVLEQCRLHQVKLVFMSSCMVYDRAVHPSGIAETDPLKPASPYAGAKIAAENLVLSYFHTYGMPVVIARPFNTYGPYQKSNGEGGVVAIFLKNHMTGEPLSIYGEGLQTRDLLYVEDCARFVIECGYSDHIHGEVINAGYGEDISIRELALLITRDEGRIRHVKHIHPQSEIPKLLCNNGKANRLLGWKPLVSLEEGLRRTGRWMEWKLGKQGGG